MKILQVLHASLPEHVGGTEVHAHQLAHALMKRKHEVACLYTTLDHARAAGAITDRSFDGVRTIERVRHDDIADVHARWIDPRADQDFASVLEREDPDVVHFQHLAGWGPRCIASAREHGCAVVVTLHDYHALCDRGTLLRADGELCPRTGADCIDCLARHPLDPPAEGVERALRLAAAQKERRAHFQQALAQAHAVIAPSRFLARTFTQAGFLSGVLVEILSPGTVGPLHRPRTRKGGKLRLGFVGKLDPAKGCHVLIDALRLLVRAPVELAVHGGGDAGSDYAKELERRAAGLAVVFHGRFDPRSVDPIYAGFDVLVAPSLAFENHPLSVQDAFRNGIPVIASELGGVSELVQDGINGLLFPRGDARALARCIEALLADPLLYNRLTRDRPASISVDSVAGRLERLYARFHAAPKTAAAPHAHPGDHEVAP